jgi:hypothetical protein
MCCLRYEYEGNLADIASDDVIPVGEEETPINVIETKISTTQASQASQAEQQDNAIEKKEVIESGYRSKNGKDQHKHRRRYFRR